VEPPDEIERLLTEIRDIQREHLEEYKRVTDRVMKLQADALARQRVAMGILAGFLLLLVLWLTLASLRG
jgi:hypothetical protein